MKTQAEKLKSEQCRRILVELETNHRTAEELVKLTKLTLGSIIKHLEVLFEANLVVLHEDGKVSLRR